MDTNKDHNKLNERTRGHICGKYAMKDHDVI